MLLPRSLRANASDTIIINSIPFNRSVLSHYNYTLYPNGTLSNVSDCYLVFGDYRPTMSNHSSLNSTIWDGTILNGTTCYAPIRRLGPHASLGMVFALLFAVTFIFTMGNLRKHGRRLLSPLNRRYASSGPGRRFKWFWMLLVAVCGVVACFMGIDVDRDYLQTTPLMLQGLFYTSLTPALMAVVWEGGRHWASTQERLSNASNPRYTPSSHLPTKQAFWLPFLFYFLALLTFFLTVPREWSPILRQNSPQQQILLSKPLATDTRFKASGFTALAGVLVICYGLLNSVYRQIPAAVVPGTETEHWEEEKHQQPPAKKRYRFPPSQFLLAILLLTVKIAYAIASAFNWSISPLRYGVHPAYLFGLGYTPALLILILFNICGWCEVNEDKLVLARRRIDNYGYDHRSSGKKRSYFRDKGVSEDAGVYYGGGHPVAGVHMDSLGHSHSGTTGANTDQEDLDRYVEMGILSHSHSHANGNGHHDDDHHHDRSQGDDRSPESEWDTPYPPNDQHGHHDQEEYWDHASGSSHGSWSETLQGHSSDSTAW